jgi:flavin-binding protein dodecin
MVNMAVVKVIEILAESKVSWEDAAQNAINEAAKTVGGINQINIENMKAVVKDNKIVMYRINTKISFIVKD